MAVDSSAFVAACAQLKASFKFKQAEAVHPAGGFKERACLLLDGFGARRRDTAPMHDDRVGLFFNQAAGCFALELRTQCIELGADRGRQRLQLATAVRMQPFGAMETPDLGRGLDPQQRQNLLSGAAGDDDHARPALALDLIQESRARRPRAAP